MSLISEGAPQRRRGSALEEALLDAAWAEFVERGYDELTMESVAARAGTSRAVLYRRWPNKQELVRAALVRQVSKDLVEIPDTGSLRGDVVALLRAVNEQRFRLVPLLLVHLGDFYRATGTSIAELRALAFGDGDRWMEAILASAEARGEIRPGQVPRRVARLPGDLFRHEVLMTLQPVPDEVLEEIVDMVFLPLVRGAAGEPTPR